MLGLCVSPGIIPSMDELAQLRPAFLRSILRTLDDLDALEATGLPLLLTLNNELDLVGWDWGGWETALHEIAARSAGRVMAVSCGNELDLFNSRDPNDVPPMFAAGLIQRAAPILRPAGIQVATTSLAGPDWQTYLARLIEQCRDDVELVDLHAYGQRPDGWGQPGWGFGDLRPTLIRARELSSKPVMMSEYGVKVGDAGGDTNQAAFLTAAASTIEQLGPDVCPRAAWFAYTDAIGAPDERGPDAFGLMAEDGRRRPAWDAFATVNTATIDVATPEPDPPLPPQEPVPMHSDDPALTVDPTPDAALSEAYRRLWAAVTPVPYQPDFAIPAYWREHANELGSPIGGEIDAGNGQTYQTFANGIVTYAPGTGVSRVV